MIEVTTRATDKAALRWRDFPPVPSDLTDFIRGDWRGPCDIKDNAVFLVVQTNMVGELHVHPCGLCGVDYVFSPEYGWVSVRDEQLRQRVVDAVRTAQTLKAPGWERK
jgi:hypothetical protein